MGPRWPDLKKEERYNWLTRLIKLWPGNWVKQMVKMNQAVGKKNRLDILVGRKRPIRYFPRNKFWKFIGRILSEVTFGVKGNQLCGKSESYVSKKG